MLNTDMGELDQHEIANMPGTTGNLVTESLSRDSAGAERGATTAVRASREIDPRDSRMSTGSEAPDLPQIGLKVQNDEMLQPRASQLTGSVDSGRRAAGAKFKGKGEELLAQSNFHQLRKFAKKQEREQAREEARRRLSQLRTLESNLLGDLD